MPKPWLYSPDRCVGKGAIFYPISVFHILTEIVIIVIPFFMMRNVQMVWQMRVKILCSFSARISVVGLAIAQLALIPSFLRSHDTTWDLVNPTICGQAMMCVSITIACLPTLYHIFAGLHSGLITTRLPDEVELRHGKRSAYINSSTVSGSGTGQGVREKQRRSTYANNARFGNIGSSVATDAVISHYNNGGSGRKSSSESTRHLTQASKRDGVLKTVDITVEVEEDYSRSFPR
ncbi:hypothetical protein BBP40_009373 [Aspergillus hancockii]|nr:hypothetical protein BBP40_009373 [Aspergillus hancockii]